MYKMNFGIILFELVILTTADLISWNRGWNGIYRFSKGKKFMERPVTSVNIPEYTRQLNSFLMKNHESEAEKSKMMAELLEKLNTAAYDSDVTSRREMKKNRKFSKNRYDRLENFKDHYLRFQLVWNWPRSTWVRNERVVLLKLRLSDSALQLKVKSPNQAYTYPIRAAKCTVINSQNSKSFIVEKFDKQLEDRSLSMNHSQWPKIFWSIILNLQVKITNLPINSCRKYIPLSVLTKFFNRIFASES